MRPQASLLIGVALSAASGGTTGSLAAAGGAGWRASAASWGEGGGDSGSGSVIYTSRISRLALPPCLLAHEIRMHDEPPRGVADELERVARDERQRGVIGRIQYVHVIGIDDARLRDAVPVH